MVGLWSIGAGTAERISGYTEYPKPGIIIVEGQRVRQSAATKLSSERVRSIEQVPLGYETEVTGVRAGDGSVVATSITARPNGKQAFEDDVLKATDEIEQEWVGRGSMYEPPPLAGTATSRTRPTAWACVTGTRRATTSARGPRCGGKFRRSTASRAR